MTRVKRVGVPDQIKRVLGKSYHQNAREPLLEDNAKKSSSRKSRMGGVRKWARLSCLFLHVRLEAHLFRWEGMATGQFSEQEFPMLPQATLGGRGGGIFLAALLLHLQVAPNVGLQP